MINIAKPSSISSKASAADVAIWGVLLVATILRLIQLGAEGVWLDEMYSLDDAISLRQGGNLSVRPLYYLILRVWMLFGSNDIVLRSLSVLLDLGAIYLAYRLCKFTLGRFPAIVTALILSLSPIHINHAQEIRMYALISFLTLAGTVSMAYALEKPTFKHISFWAVMRLLAIFTSPLMLFMIIADFVLFTLSYWRNFEQFKKFIYGLLFIGAAWSPIIFPKFLQTVFGYVQDHAVKYDAGTDITLTNTLSRLTQFTVFWPLGSEESSSSFVPLLYYKVFTLLLLGLLLLGLTVVRFNLKSRPLWIATWAFVPLSLQYLACETVMGGTIWRPRYLLYLSPYLIMLISLGVKRVFDWKPAIGFVIATLYLVAVFGGLQFYYTMDYRPQWGDISALVETQERPNDVIVNYTWMGDRNFPRYYDGNSELVTLHLPRNQSAEERLAMVQSARNRLPEADRLWLICQSGCKDQAEFEIISEAVVGDQATETFFQSFENVLDKQGNLGGIDLYLLTPAD